jgi:RHS repeat-associated protein
MDPFRASGRGGGAAYVYDGNGNRVKKCVPSCSGSNPTTVYIFSGSKVIAEYPAGSTGTSFSAEYLYAGGLKVATVTSSAQIYHLRDHLSVRVNTDSSGALVGEQGHYPFGDNWYMNSTTTKEMFTTYERDPETGSGSAGTGNDYAMARYNGNRLGRFSSIDPLSGNIGNPQSLNHYAYVTNDPINMADPLGLDPSSSGSDVCTVNPGLPVCNYATAVGGDPGDLNCTLDGISTNCGSINQQDANACVFSGCKGFLRGPNGESEIVYEMAYANSTATTLQYVALSAVQIEVLGLSPEFGNFAGLFPSLSPSGGGGGGGGRTCFTSRVQTAVPDASPTGTSQNQGGHNEINFTAPASALGPIQSNAFSIAGVNNGYRIGGLIYSLHINNVTALTPTTIGFQAHEDVFNPASGLVGLIGHTVVDLAIGTVFFHHSSNLDGKC